MLEIPLDLSTPKNRLRRPQFGIRTVLVLLAILAAIFALPHVYWRYFATPSIGWGDILECQRTEHEKPYRVVNMRRAYALNEWLAQTRHCYIPSVSKPTE